MSIQKLRRKDRIALELDYIKEHLWAIENSLERLKEHLEKLEKLT